MTGMSRDVFWVVNDNPKTRNPTTGERMTHRFCYRNGIQGPMPEATMYFSEKNAQRLCDKLNKNGIDVPDWTVVAGLKQSPGKYRIIKGELKAPEQDEVS